jgi:hypothetical protein
VVDDEPDAPASETVAFGGETAGGRFSRWVERRSARQARTMFVGSTVLLGALVLVAIAVSNGPDDREPNIDTGAGSPAPPPPPPLPPPPAQSTGATVYIGYRGVMVAVPRHWVGSKPRPCRVAATAPPRDWVRARCSPSTASPTTMVWLRQSASGGTERVDIAADDRLTLGEPRRVADTFSQAVVSETAGTVVVVSSTSRNRLAQIVGSARPIPSDWVTVPDLVSTDPARSMRRVAELGLVPWVNHNSGMVLPARTVVVDQSPAEGRVVAPGTRVAFSVLPASGSP